MDESAVARFARQMPDAGDRAAIVEALRSLGFTRASLIEVDDRAHYFFVVPKAELAGCESSTVTRVLSASIPGRKAEALEFANATLIPIY